MSFLICVETRKTGHVRYFAMNGAVLQNERTDAMMLDESQSKAVAEHLAGMFPKPHYRIIVLDEREATDDAIERTAWAEQVRDDVKSARGLSQLQLERMRYAPSAPKRLVGSQEVSTSYNVTPDGQVSIRK